MLSPTASGAGWENNPNRVLEAILSSSARMDERNYYITILFSVYQAKSQSNPLLSNDVKSLDFLLRIKDEDGRLNVTE